ncbi:hypothetical protein A4A49_23899 [Nicotiana attenuata]|uniref:SWIM-type domain-containing protein n=1 Tax=Nicotiana attenuata TaxID=49451 RepID=A0A1J6KVP9_NICAT|nr:hypothetical protein A4A49_23899 [Nicotiana attenuata]
MRYATVGGFYYQDPKNKNFVYVDSDALLFNIVCNLENVDGIHLYIQHIVLDPELVDDVAPTGLIGGPEIGVTEVNGTSGETNIEKREDVAAETEVREDVAAETGVREDVAAETKVREYVDADLNGVRREEAVRKDASADLSGVGREEVVEGDVIDLDGAISDLESSSDSDFDVVLEEDDSDSDEELIAVRNEKRTNLKARRRKKPIVHVEVPLEEGNIDRGISPMARVILEENKEFSRKCKVLWFETDGFEVDEYEYRYIVNLRRRTCTCRSWQLRGIPCAHAICEIYHQEEESYNYVDHWYRKETFLKAYQYFLEPNPDMKMCTNTNNMVIEPPAPKPMPGKPQKKRRRPRMDLRKRSMASSLSKELR